MDLTRSRAVAKDLIWLEQVDSTNTQLIHLATEGDSSPTPSFTVVATGHQTAGKGRLGRSWQAPADTALAVSVLVRPETSSSRPVPLEQLSWFGLLAGLAMSRACDAVLPTGLATSVKWPNDVLIGDKKVCGVLSELCMTPTGPAVVVGAGVNILLTEDQLPVPTATSLKVAGAQSITIDDVLSRYLEEFFRVAKVFLAAGGDMNSSGLLDHVRSACSTLGQPVRVELPSSELITGTATDLRANGSLEISVGEGLQPLVVAAGDVTHLRVIIDRD